MTDTTIVPAGSRPGALASTPAAAVQRAARRAARRAAATTLERRRRLLALQRQLVTLQAEIGRVAGAAAHLDAVEAARPLTPDEKREARRAALEQTRLALELQRIAAEYRLLPAPHP